MLTCLILLQRFRDIFLMLSFQKKKKIFLHVNREKNNMKKAKIVALSQIYYVCQNRYFSRIVDSKVFSKYQYLTLIIKFKFSKKSTFLNAFIFTDEIMINLCFNKLKYFLLTKRISATSSLHLCRTFPPKVLFRRFSSYRYT
jgi:hypothetical protein